MLKVQTFAWCTLSAMIGFSAAQLVPSLTSDRTPQTPRASTPVLASGQLASDAANAVVTPAPARDEPKSRAVAASPTLPARRSPTPPTALRPPAEPTAAQATQAAAARPTRASLLSSFRFAGFGTHGGIRLGRVTPGSLPDLLGLKTGDEVITLNGLRIADPQKALQAYAQLPYVDAWTARIHRDGAQTELRYALR